LQNHDFVELFSRFWWLIFPLWWMLVRLIRSLRSTSAQDRALEVLRIYAAKGETPPPEVLQALARMTGPGPDYAPGGAFPTPPPPGRASGAWWTFFVFAALTAGFAVGVNGFGASDVQAHTAFTIVAVVMAFMAAGSLVMAIFASLRGGR
jgi:hypothetical protein